MIRVKLTLDDDQREYPQIRQTPGRRGIWGDCQFFINQEMPEFDWWVVYDDLPRPERACGPPRNTVLITGEPPSVKTYSRRFVRQFAAVITCQAMKHPNVIRTQQSLPWVVGHRYLKQENRWEHGRSKDYDDLMTMPPVRKTKLLSVISSDKAFTAGHRQRLRFVHRLKQHFGDGVDVFGNGLHDFEDKWDVIAPYQYHVVLENSRFRDYWTEKISDAFLADAYPFYSGCPNITDYFPPEALTPIDPLRFERAVEAITQGMKEGRYAASAEARRAAKDLVLNKYNLFAEIAALAAGNTPVPAGEAADVVLHPQSAFNDRASQGGVLGYGRRLARRLGVR